MKERLVLLVILICFGFSAHSQKKDKNTVRTSESSCIRKSNIAFSKRAQYFPYNSHSQVKLISFKSEKALIAGPDLMKYLDSLVLNFGVFDEKEFFESTTLTSDQIENLTDLVFNIGSNSRNVDISSCYSSRNAIIFLDEQSRVYALSNYALNATNTELVIQKLH